MRSSLSIYDRNVPKSLRINDKIAFVENEMVAHVDLCSLENKMENSKTAWHNYDLYEAPTKFRYLIQIFDHPVHGINFNRLKLQIQLKGKTLSTFSLLFS